MTLPYINGSDLLTLTLTLNIIKYIVLGLLK